MQLALFNHTMEWMKRQPLTDYPEIQANPEALVIVFECPDDISDHVNFLLKIIKPETTTKKIAWSTWHTLSSSQNQICHRRANSAYTYIQISKRYDSFKLSRKKWIQGANRQQQKCRLNSVSHFECDTVRVSETDPLLRTSHLPQFDPRFWNLAMKTLETLRCWTTGTLDWS